MKIWPLPGFGLAPDLNGEGIYDLTPDFEYVENVLRALHAGDLSEALLVGNSLLAIIEARNNPRQGRTPQAQMMYDKLVASQSEQV